MRFLFVDEVVAMEPGVSIHARRTWPADLDVFSDHFPGMPVVPGVLLTEMMGQTAGVCIEAAPGAPGKPMLAQIRGATFRRFVKPDELIDVHAQVKSLKPTFALVSCRAEVAGAAAADAELLLSFVPWDAPGAQFRNEALERYRRAHGG